MTDLAAPLAAPLAASEHLRGLAGAPLTLIEYGDFECPTCKQAAPAVKLLLERFAGRIGFAFRHFPLVDAHPHALEAAEAAECAGAQGRFWEMHDLLFENQLALTRPDLEGYAARLSLDLERFSGELTAHVHRSRVLEHIESGRRSHVRGTPGFFLNGRIVDISFGMRRLFEAAEAATATI